MTLTSRTALLIASSFATLVLTACGGGGSSNNDGATDTQAQSVSGGETASAQAVRVTTATPVSYVIYGSGWTSAPLTSVFRSTAPMSSQTGYSPQFSGTGYYVDQATGNDNNPGTIDAPWRTLAKASTAPLRAGDALLLNCGSVWRESLEITSAQGRDGDFLVGGYGDCSGDRRPIIRASDWIPQTAWAQVADETRPIFAKKWGTVVTRLFVDGKPQIPARYPNFKSIGAEYSLATGLGSRKTFGVKANDLAVLANKDLVGATVHIKTAAWLLSSAKIQSFDSSTGAITLDQDLPFTVREGTGYIIEGKRWMLDTPGEWYYDAATGELLIWTNDGASPANHAGIEAAWRDYGLTIRWSKNVRVERIRVDQQSQDGIRMIETPGAIVSDVVSAHAHEHGISIISAANTAIRDSVVQGAGRRGIVSRETDNAQIIGNRVSDTGGNGRSDDTDGALTIFGQGSVVRGNLVERSANAGIFFGNRANTLIEDNTVFESCLRFTDCAGIYTWTASAPALPPTAYEARATVRNNVIVGARSNSEGCAPACKNMALAIYLDELTSGATISGNNISDAEVGIGLHNSPYNIVQGNTIRNVSFSSMRMSQTRTTTGIISGNKILNNSLVSGKTMAMLNGIPSDVQIIPAIYWFHGSDPAAYFTSLGTIVSGNTNLTTERNAEATWVFATWTTNKPLPPADWKKYATTDVIRAPATYRNLVSTTEGDLLRNGTFSPSITDGWSTYFDTSAGTGGAFNIGNYANCGGNCGRFTPASQNDQLRTKPFQMNATSGQSLHVFRMTAIGGATGGTRNAYIRRNESPWDNYGFSMPTLTVPAGQQAEVEYFFLAKSADAGVLDLRAAGGSEAFIKKVSVQRVTSVEFADPTKFTAHIINPTTTNLSFPCVALKLSTCDAVDEAGNKITWPLVVAARSSAQVYALDTKWRLP